jgi:RNA polymerase sigma factor (sigma-70 family)
MDVDSGRDENDDVLVLPPLPADPIFVEAVEDAVVGGSADLPDAQPQRPVNADPRDFASLYIRHRSSFGLHARRFLYDPRDVEEVLQEAFLRLFLAMPELETEMQALAYCRRTVTNLCIDRYRADQRRPRLVDLDTIEWDPRDEASYDDPVLRAEDAAIVRQALALLTPMHRAALVKREIEEKPLPQIAAELGVPEESVKHLLYRARRALRRLLVGTSVEPGADLSNTAILKLANERLARATLRSANVLIVLFVTAVTVVGALRVGANDQQARSGEVGAAVSPVLGGKGANPPAQSLSRSHHATKHAAKKPASHSTSRHPITAPAAASLSLSRPTASTTHKPSHAPSVHTTRPSRAAKSPSYSLRGSLRPVGPVRVRSLSRVIDAGSGTTATSLLSAPTTKGTFSLTQTIVAANDGSATVTVQPTLSAFGQKVTSLVTSAAAVTRDPTGTMVIDAVARDVSGVASPVGSVQLHLVLAGDFVHVLSESVVVSETPAASTDASTADVTSTTCSSDSNTTPPTNVAGAVSPNPVIGMSPEWPGDQLAPCTSTTDGGSFPLLPSPAQP